MLSNNDLEILLSKYNRVKLLTTGSQRAIINSKIELLEFILNKNNNDKMSFNLLEYNKDIKIIESEN